MNNINKGILGENLAIKFLKQNGYTIISKNIRYKKIEIDIIAEKNSIIHIIEVKYRSNLDFFQLKLKQIENIKNFCEIFYTNQICSIDIILIYRYQIYYYPNYYL